MTEPTATGAMEALILQALQELWPHYGCVLCGTPITPSVGWKPAIVMGEKDKRVNTVIITIACGGCVNSGAYAQAVERARKAAGHFRPGGDVEKLVNSTFRPGN